MKLMQLFLLLVLVAVCSAAGKRVNLKDDKRRELQGVTKKDLGIRPLKRDPVRKRVPIGQKKIAEIEARRELGYLGKKNIELKKGPVMKKGPVNKKFDIVQNKKHPPRRELGNTSLGKKNIDRKKAPVQKKQYGARRLLADARRELGSCMVRCMKLPLIQQRTCRTGCTSKPNSFF